MNEPLDLKSLERKAWTAYFQDGLWDMYLGLLLAVVGLSDLFMPQLDVLWMRLVGYLVLFGGSWLLFWAGRRFLTFPRLGRARFSASRRRRKAHLTIILSAFVVLTLLLMVLTVVANNNPDTWGRYMPNGVVMPLFIGVFVGAVIAVVAYFNDFVRGFYIALIYALAFAGGELFVNPLAFWIGSVLVFIPGLVLLVRFLRHHPMPPNEVIHDQSEL